MYEESEQHEDALFWQPTERRSLLRRVGKKLLFGIAVLAGVGKTTGRAEAGPACCDLDYARECPDRRCSCDGSGDGYWFWYCDAHGSRLVCYDCHCDECSFVAVVG
jgi:hypothetical protein